MKLSLKILHHQGNKISFAHQVLILDFCRNLAAHCHIVIVKMYSRTLAYNYVDKWAGGLGRKRFIFTRGFASKCFKAHKKRQLPGKLSAFQITAITTALHDNKNVKKRKGHLHKAREKKLVTKARLAMVLHLIGRKRGVSFLNQLQSGMKQNHCNSGLFSTLDKKIALLSY